MTAVLLLVVAGVLVAAYGSVFVARRLGAPSAVILIALGLFASLLWPNSYHHAVSGGLELLGSLGLVLIVLEGALDLHLTRERVPLIRRAAAASVVITLVTSVLIAAVLHFALEAPVRAALLVGVAFGILSSAILIPSLVGMRPELREFLTYESVISDIVGILCFSLVIDVEVFDLNLLWSTIGKLLVTSALGLGGALALTYVLKVTERRHTFFLILALLLAVYAVGKLLHLPTLLVILVFGVLVNNLDRVRDRFPVARVPQLPEHTLNEFRMLNDESSFVVRSFFFVILGYSISPADLIDPTAWLVASLLLAVIYCVRALGMSIWVRTNVMQLTLLAPRGLVTIILYLSIPAQLQIVEVGPPVVSLVVVFTALVMGVGLLLKSKQAGVAEHA
jgi:NhaP-type Na+/H+ or K+/H+ antiporter